MRHDEILQIFSRARSAMNIEKGALLNRAEIDRILRPALEKYGYLVEERIPFRPPYRIEETREGVFFKPHQGRRISISNEGLYHGIDYIKRERQQNWERELFKINRLFGIEESEVSQLSRDDLELYRFIRSMMLNDPACVKFRKQTGHYGISEVINTFKAYYETLDPDARSIAARTYSKLTFGRYVDVRNNAGAFIEFAREGALGVRHLFPELKELGIAESIRHRCNPAVTSALREKGLRYLYNAHEYATSYLNAEECVIGLPSSPTKRTQAADALRLQELRDRVDLLVEGLNQAVAHTGELPPEQLLFSFMSNVQKQGTKPFVAACILFSQGRARMRDLLPHVTAKLATTEKLSKMDVDDCLALIDRSIHNSLHRIHSNRGVRINDVLFKYVSDTQKNNSSQKLLAFYRDPDSGQPTCRLLKRSFLARHPSPGQVNALEVSRAPGFAVKTLNEKIAERPSRLFSLIDSDLALSLYASTPQGARMLGGKSAIAFLERVALASLKKMDAALLESALKALNERDAHLDPGMILAENRAWLFKEEQGQLLEVLLAQHELQGERAACIPPEWVLAAVSQQVSVKVMERLIDHLNAALPESAILAFERYHTKSGKIDSFLNSCKMISSMRDPSASFKVNNSEADLELTASADTRASRPAFARNIF